MTVVRRAIGLLAAATLAVALAGCAASPTDGWTTRSSYRSDLSTIAVPIFVNETFIRDIQFDLADAIQKQVQAATPWKLAAANQADTILVGTIREARIVRLAKSPTTGLAEQDGFQITVDFEWRDQRSGRTLVQRERFSASGFFVPTITGGEVLETGRFGAVQELARDIVATLRSDW